MSFPETHRAIREMIGDTLLATPMARDIVRKGLGLISAGGSAGTPLLIDLLEEHSLVQYDITGHEQYGSLISYTSLANSPFPQGSTRMMRFWDFSQIEWFRLIANITEVGPSGGVLYLSIFQDVGDGTNPAISFEVGAPSVPADSLGLHVSEWRRAEWLEVPETLSGRPAMTLPWLTNPTGSPGSIGIGLAQILVKGG